MRRLTDILDGVQGLVAAEAARMSLEEEVNQSVSRAVSLAEAAEAANAAADDDSRDDDRDLAMLAPPAPETVAAGAARRRAAARTTASPSRAGRAWAGDPGCTRLRSPLPSRSTGPCPSAAG